MSHLEDWFVKHFIKKRGGKKSEKAVGQTLFLKNQKNLPRSKWKLRAGFKCKTCAGTCGQTSCTRLQPFPECTSGNQRSVVDRSSVSTGRVDATILVVTDNLRSTWRACGWTAGGKQMTHTGEVENMQTSHRKDQGLYLNRGQVLLSMFILLLVIPN